MSRINYIEDLEYESIKGADTTTPLASLQPGFVRDAQNADLGLTGGISKRNGYTNQVTSAWGSRSIVAGIEYKTTGGTSQTILYGQDGTDGRFGTLSAGSVTAIATGLSKTARPSFVQLGNLLFSYNGVDAPILYDGSVTRQVGITTPLVAPTITSQTTGGQKTLLGAYRFAYTYYNSVTLAESSPSPLSPQVVLTGSNNEIVLGITAGSSTTADTIRIWSTVANGNALFLEGTAAIGSTSYTALAADSSLTIALEIDNTRITTLSSTAKYPMVAANRVFVVTNDNEIRFSKIGQSGPMPESFQVQAVTTTVGKNGNADFIVGLGSIGDIPIVVKKGSVGRLEQIGLNSATSAIDPVAFNYQEISNIIGGVSHWAGVQVLNEYVWLGRENIYATDGSNIRRIADPITATIKSLGFLPSQITKVSAANYTKNRQVFFSVFTSGSASVPALVLVGDYKTILQQNGDASIPEFRWTFYKQGTTPATHPGIQASCFFPVTDSTNGNVNMWFGNAIANGKAYQMDTGTNDDGSAIYFKVVSRPYCGQHPMYRKLFKTSRIHAQGNSNTYNLTVSCIYDLATQEQNSTNLSLANSGGLWDNVIWDQFLWSDDSVVPLRFDAHQKAYFQQLVFTQTQVDCPVSILGWGTSASIFKAF